ncbi:MAG: type II toxin-antitoxin system HicB family antitoxin [Candidatus Thiodiazotropha sp. (ex Epidulcina cf. delphinae)]|nr:type II toxin-antitoxin system HicB family antitoxin [Candidatus Thiodiazotropha sp. (ex Epidulcina cf. delphinae)]
MNMMEYKGYAGTVEYSPEDHCLYGKLAYIRDLVNYEATHVEDLEREFQAAVDDYLKDCEDIGKAPNKPFKGTFNVRIGTELHRAAVIASGEKSLNTFVCEAIKEKVERHERSA